MQYVSRAAAGLRPPRSRQTLGRVSALWLHHEGGPRRTGTDEAAAWRAIQAFSMNSLGYADTDYSFGVGLSGTIYEGRGWGVMSAATLNNNATSYSICAIGNFETEDEPTEELLAGIATVCRDGFERGFLTPGVYPTGGHRDAPNMGGFSTSCPGRKLEAALPRIRELVTNPQSAAVDWAAIARFLEEIDMEHGQAVDVVFEPNPADPAHPRGYVLERWGSVTPVNGAKAIDHWTGGAAPYWPGKDVARRIVVTDWNRPSGYVMDLDGGLHGFGACGTVRGGPYWKSGKILDFAET